MDAGVAVHVAVLDATTNHVTIDVHVPVTRIDVDVRHLDIGPRPPTPSAGVAVVPRIPAVVVDRARPPVAVVREPATDRKTDTERPERRVIPRAVDWTRVDHIGVVDRHIDDPRLRRRDHVVAIIARHRLLRRGGQVPLAVSHGAHALYGEHHVARLHGVRPAQRSGPVQLFGQHVQDGRVVCDRLDAHIPRLVVDAIRPVAAHVARRIHQLLREGGGNQHLCQQGIGVERDRADEIVELIREVLVQLVRVLGRRAALLRVRRRGPGE